jgi:hypothetical protein
MAQVAARLFSAMANLCNGAPQSRTGAPPARRRRNIQQRRRWPTSYPRPYRRKRAQRVHGRLHLSARQEEPVSTGPAAATGTRVNRARAPHTCNDPSDLCVSRRLRVKHGYGGLVWSKCQSCRNDLFWIKAPRSARRADGRAARRASRPGRLRRRGGNPPTLGGQPPAPGPTHPTARPLRKPKWSATAVLPASDCRTSPHPGLACPRVRSHKPPTVNQLSGPQHQRDPAARNQPTRRPRQPRRTPLSPLDQPAHHLPTTSRDGWTEPDPPRSTTTAPDQHFC